VDSREAEKMSVVESPEAEKKGFRLAGGGKEEGCGRKIGRWRFFFLSGVFLSLSALLFAVPIARRHPWAVRISTMPTGDRKIA
jgi:hypothetical protein